MNVEQEFKDLMDENKQASEEVEYFKNAGSDDYFENETYINTLVQAQYRLYKHFLEKLAEEEPCKVIEYIQKGKKELKEIPILDIDFEFDNEFEEE